MQPTIFFKNYNYESVSKILSLDILNNNILYNLYIKKT